MATRQDLAFLRHAAGAGLMTTPGAQGCLRALEEALARGRQVSAAALAVELGLLDEATARQVLAASLAAAPPPPPPPAGTVQLPPGSVLPLPPPAGTVQLPPGSVLPLPPPAGTVRLPALAAPLPLPSGATDAACRTFIDDEVVPLPEAGEAACRTFIDDEVVPLPGAGEAACRTFIDDEVVPLPEAGEAACRTLLGDEVVPLPGAGEAACRTLLGDEVVPLPTPALDAGVTLLGEDDPLPLPGAGGATVLLPPGSAPVALPGALLDDDDADAPVILPTTSSASAPAPASTPVPASTPAPAPRPATTPAPATAPAPSADGDAEGALARAIAAAARERAAPAPAPAARAASSRTASRPATSSASGPGPAPASRGGAVYLVGAGLAIVVMVGGAVASRPERRDGPTPDLVERPAPPPIAVGVAVAPAAPPREGGPGPEALLVAHADQVRALIAQRRFREARALDEALPPATLADGRRRERVEALRRQLDDTHRAAVARERRAALDLVRDGDVSLARRVVREALAWALDDARAQLARDLDEALRQRSAPLVALAPAREVAADGLEQRVRALLGEDGCDAAFFPNGAVVLDYGLTPAALARDLRLVGADVEGGPRVDASGRGLTLVHVLPLAQTCEVAVDLEALRVGPRGHVALVVGAPTAKPTQLTPGVGWDGVAVHVTAEGRLVRDADEPRPVAAGAVVRVRIDVTPGPAPGITLDGVVEDRKADGRHEVAPRAWPARRGSAGRVALVLQDVDVRVRSLQVRGLVDPDALPAR